MNLSNATHYLNLAKVPHQSPRRAQQKKCLHKDVCIKMRWWIDFSINKNNKNTYEVTEMRCRQMLRVNCMNDLFFRICCDGAITYPLCHPPSCPWCLSSRSVLAWIDRTRTTPALAGQDRHFPDTTWMACTAISPSAPTGRRCCKAQRNTCNRRHPGEYQQSQTKKITTE